jgi:hypothetical protein
MITLRPHGKNDLITSEARLLPNGQQTINQAPTKINQFTEKHRATARDWFTGNHNGTGLHLRHLRKTEHLVVACNPEQHTSAGSLGFPAKVEQLPWELFPVETDISDGTRPSAAEAHPGLSYLVADIPNKRRKQLTGKPRIAILYAGESSDRHGHASEQLRFAQEFERLKARVENHAPGSADLRGIELVVGWDEELANEVFDVICVWAHREQGDLGAIYGTGDFQIDPQQFQEAISFANPVIVVMRTCWSGYRASGTPAPAAKLLHGGSRTIASIGFTSEVTTTGTVPHNEILLALLSGKTVLESFWHARTTGSNPTWATGRLFISDIEALDHSLLRGVNVDELKSLGHALQPDHHRFIERHESGNPVPHSEVVQWAKTADPVDAIELVQAMPEHLKPVFWETQPARLKELISNAQFVGISNDAIRAALEGRFPGDQIKQLLD